MDTQPAGRAVKSWSVETEDGVSLRVLETGPEDGQVVVLVHGVGASADVWSGVMTSDRIGPGIRIVAFDLRGHGPGSSPLDEAQLRSATSGAPFQVWTRDLDAVCSAVGPTDLVGWSFGCTVISAWLRSQNGESFFDTGRRVVLSCASNALGSTDLWDPASRLTTDRAVQDVVGCATGGEAAYAHRMLATGLAGDDDVDTTGPRMLLEASARQADPAAVAAALAPFDDRAFWSDMPVARRDQVTVLAAGSDQFFDRTALADCWAQVGKDIGVLSGSAHAAPLTRPDDFSAALATSLISPAG